MMSVEIVKGQVRISSVIKSIDTPDVKVINVDSQSKRYNIHSRTRETGNVQKNIFKLIPTKESLNLDDSSDEDTQIIFTHENGEKWDSITETHAKYDFRIVLIKRESYTVKDGVFLWDERDSETLWENEDR